MGAMPGDQTQSLLQADATDRYLASRADTMQNIEGTIVELGGIFQQLAHMLKEQEEMMVRIFYIIFMRMRNSFSNFHTLNLE